MQNYLTFFFHRIGLSVILCAKVMQHLPSVEILRKLVHLSSLIYPLLYLVVSKPTMLLITFTLLIVLFSFDYLRKSNKIFNQFFCKYCGFALRDSEKSGNFTGSTYFMLGTFLSILFFPQNITILALFVLIISDTFASIVGISFGKRKILNNSKSIEGAIAFLLSAFVISIVGLIVFKLPLLPLVIASIFATFLELLSKKIKIDDNILIPLGYGLIATLFI